MAISDLASDTEPCPIGVGGDAGVDSGCCNHGVTLAHITLGCLPLIPPGAQPERRSLIIEGEFSNGSAGEGSAGP